jgi:ABC-type amino acid transport substrate-binding protein
MVATKYLAVIGIVIVGVAAFAAGLVARPYLFPVVRQDPVWARVSSTKTIIVATEPGWPPYEFTDAQGNIIGFEVDITNRIAQRLGFTVQWRDMGFDSIIPAVQAGDIDMGVSGFSVTADRLQVVEFTMPHSITEGQVIMLQSRANALGITQLKSLSNLTDYGLTCGTQTGTTEEGELNSLAPQAVRSYTDYLLALQAMKSGMIDCVYAETPITSNWILGAAQNGTEPIVIVFRRPYYPVAFVVSKDAFTFLDKVNGALADMIASGELDQLRAKWKT